MAVGGAGSPIEGHCNNESNRCEHRLDLHYLPIPESRSGRKSCEISPEMNPFSGRSFQNVFSVRLSRSSWNKKLHDNHRGHCDLSDREDLQGRTFS